MSKHRISSWYLIPKFTLLQRRSLGNRVVCFCGVKRLQAFGSTRSQGAGDRMTVTTGGDRSVDGYDGPFTCRDYGVDGSRNGGGKSVASSAMGVDESSKEPSPKIVI